jgi:DNA-binding NtrC family response regulator
MEFLGKTVLIVDDSSSIRDELRQEFTLHGFACAEAENGRVAIDRARTSRPGLIVLDLSMPIMNGLDTAPELRKVLPDTPIILYTAYGDAASVLDMHGRGVTAILAKTEPLDILVALAKKLMEAPGSPVETR